MKKLLAALAIVGLTAVPASAGQIGVNAARNAVAWDSTDMADVFVSTYAGDVEVIGSSYYDPNYPEGSWESTAWFTVKVTGVGAGSLSVAAPTVGDCTGQTITFKRRPHGRVIVRIEHHATGGDDFDCTYRRIAVRW